MHLSGSIPPGGTQPLVIKYATPPKIPPTFTSASTPDPDTKLSSPPQAKEIPPVGDLPTPSSLPLPHSHLLPSPYPSSELYPPTSPIGLPLPHPASFSPHPASFSPHAPFLPPHRGSLNQIVFVTINGIPSTFDLMTFNFLTSYGRVVEGKVFYQTTTAYGNFLSPSPPSGIALAPAATQLGTIRYSILMESTQQIANILALDGSVVVVSGVPVVVCATHFHLPHCLSLSLSLSLSQLNVSL
jgi:hypothetical protein